MGFYKEGINFFRDEYVFLSDFYPAEIEYKGVRYYNSEAAYQAQKCKNREDMEQFTKLYANEAKSLGSEIELRSDWDEVKVGIMEEIVREKFTQNPKLAKKLSDTGDQVIREGNNWGDLFWGVDLETGEGENHLGIILMELREEFRINGLPEIYEESDVLPEKGMDVKMEDASETSCACYIQLAHKKTMACGDCVIDTDYTAAEDSSVPRIIYAVAPDYGTENDCENLAKCYRNILNTAMENEIHSIALPVLSVGRLSFPRDLAMQIALDSITEWLNQNPDYPIYICFYTLEHKIYYYIKNYINQHFD